MYYVVQVCTGKEDKAIRDIKTNSSDPLGIDVFTPSRVELRKIHGTFKRVLVSCFPGYVFVETSDPKRLFFDLHHVEEFTKLLGREGYTYHFIPLDADESRIIDILYNTNNDRCTPISDIEILESDTIRIVSGPLANLEAKVKKVNLHKRKVTVEVLLCSRILEVDLGINIVTKV